MSGHNAPGLRGVPADALSDNSAQTIPGLNARPLDAKVSKAIRELAPRVDPAPVNCFNELSRGSALGRHAVSHSAAAEFRPPHNENPRRVRARRLETAGLAASGRVARWRPAQDAARIENAATLLGGCRMASATKEHTFVYKVIDLGSGRSYPLRRAGISTDGARA